MSILYSFGCGIAFAAGVTVGAILCRMATKEGRNAISVEWKAHQKLVEERLTASLLCHQRLAAAAEAIAKKDSNG